MFLTFSEINDGIFSLPNAYVHADRFSTKRQILAIVAADFPASTLKAYFPGATDYLIKQARNHVHRHGKHSENFCTYSKNYDRHIK